MFTRTADSDHAWPAAPNIIDQDFTAPGAAGTWGVDISDVWTRAGWPCLAVITGLFSRKIAGFAAGGRLHRDLAPAALGKALAMRRPGEGLIHHSGRGRQYCPADDQAGLRWHGIAISMSGKANCDANAIAGTFFKRLKSGLVWRTVFATRTKPGGPLPAPPGGFHNPVRRHSAPGCSGKTRFEKLASG